MTLKASSLLKDLGLPMNYNFAVGYNPKLSKNFKKYLCENVTSQRGDNLY